MTESIPVLLGRCATYEQRRLHEFFDRCAPLCRLPATLAGKTVLLKPNLVSALAPPLACTDGRFLRAVAEWFLDHGARLLIGDSPSLGSAAQVLQRQGISRLLADLDIKVVEFNTPRPVRLAHGVTIGIAEEALACDLLVNLPKIKAHSQMQVTLAVKNLFGIVCGMRKALAHMKNGPSHHRFADLLLDLLALLPEHLTLVDGIEVMHRRGPARGDRLHLGCLAAGRHPVAIDYGLIEVLELAAERCPICAVARQRGMAGSDPAMLVYPFEEPAAFHGSGFIAPVHLAPVPFNPLRFLINSLRRLIGGLVR
ncbi:MAG: DUF362 domain-containing protein [Desulfofustis sp.]|nr:DUF362 domain-containing protein [Desulfofustis sp.]